MTVEDLSYMSRGEAFEANRKIIATILRAYELGMNVALENMDNPLGDLLDANHAALTQLFPDMPRQDAAKMLALSLREQVRKEDRDALARR